MWEDKSHPIWKLAYIVVIGGLGLAYCSLAYRNGVDLVKDGGLIALMTGGAALWSKFTAPQ